ncbi:MAG: aldo/keto reductase [Deltaproteobacteria bacterium]|nr:aldo/keto reductase [Deltaproteobacteria bacterium]
MRTCALGNTGLEVTELGMGGIPIMRVGAEEAVSIIRHCIDLGIRFFDTAHVYGDSEEKLGRALEPFRDRVVIATKVWAKDGPGAAEQLAMSLDRLRTDRIDLMQCHNVTTREDMDRVLAPGGACEVLERARAEGRVQAVGFSSHSPEIAVRMCETGRFSTLQFPFNFIERDAADRLFPTALERGMGIIGMKPLGGGFLDRADLCFRFLQQHPHVIPIPGIQSMAEIDEIAGVYSDHRPMSASEQEEIEGIRRQYGTRFCRRCEYCMPCERGVQIPRVMLFKTQVRRFPPDLLFTIARDAMATVEGCEECGECVQKCPYDLPIPDMLRENLELYERFLAEQGFGRD